MSTLEIQQELHDFINNSDEKSIRQFYEMAKSYIAQRKQDKMIAEGEADIKADKLHSQQEIKDYIKNWTL